MTGPHPAPSRHADGRWRFFAAQWVLLSLVAALWSLGMPLTTGPDEPSHFVKAAAVVRGDLLGTEGPEGTIVRVPAYVAYTNAQTCTAYNPNQTANCGPATPEPTGALMEATTTAGKYNPVYYVLVGWPSLLFADQAGLYGMRIMSGILASAFFALGLMMLGGLSRRTIPLVAGLIALTPMVIYVNGIVNPSSLEIAATFAAFIALLCAVIDPRPHLLRERMIILAVAGSLACSTRSISPLWVAILLLIPLLLLSGQALVAFLRTRVVLVSIAVVALVAASAIGWIVLSSSLALNAPAASGSTTYDDVGASPAFGFVKMVLLTFNIGQEMIGILGWFDTQLPAAVYFVWSALVGSLALAAAVVLRGRRAAVALALLTSLIIGPAVIQAAYISTGGFIWQGRYSLPLFASAIVGVAVLISESLPNADARMSRRLVVIISAAWVSCQALALLQALRRYTVGASGSYGAIFTGPEWAPPLGAGVLLATATLALALVTVVLFFRPRGYSLTR